MPLAASVFLLCSAGRIFFGKFAEVKRGCGPRSLASLGGLNMQVTAILASIEVQARPMLRPIFILCQ